MDGHLGYGKIGWIREVGSTWRGIALVEHVICNLSFGCHSIRILVSNRTRHQE